jgi:hypothetical protein
MLAPKRFSSTLEPVLHRGRYGQGELYPKRGGSIMAKKILKKAKKLEKAKPLIRMGW